MLDLLSQVEFRKSFLSSQHWPLITTAPTTVAAPVCDTGAVFEVVETMNRVGVSFGVIGFAGHEDAPFPLDPLRLVGFVGVPPSTADATGSCDQTITVMTTLCSLGHGDLLGPPGPESDMLKSRAWA